MKIKHNASKRTPAAFASNHAPLSLKQNIFKISAGTLALLAVAMAPISAQTILTTTNDATILRVWTDDTYTTAFSTSVGNTGNTFQVGNDTDEGTGGRPVEWRSIMKFDISSLSGTIGTTTLTLTANSTVGTPNAIFIDSIDDNTNAIAGAAEFDAATGGFSAIAGSETLVNGDIVTLDVTSFIQADVTAGLTYSTLRFYESPLNTSNTLSNVRIFQSSENPNGSFDPTLTVVPEPTTGALIIGLGALFLAFARRRVK